ncbi:MAG: restriction endonuclease [Oscillospiraceae bacterium]|nr:restriction endonuclease [Oscillospiraceae bacterium]
MDTSKTNKLWAVHSLGDTFSTEQGNIAFDWPEMGDLNALEPDRDAFRKKFDTAYPDANAANKTAVAGALYRLVYEVEPGDYVACLHGETVSLGTVSGAYAFRDNAHTRPVNWLKHVPQSEFSRDAMREMTCSPVRLFAVKRFAGEFLSPLGVAWLEPERPTRPAVSVADTVPASATVAASAATSTLPASAVTTAPGGRTCVLRAADYTGTETAAFVLNALRRYLTRENFRQFAAGLLRAMGYTISLPPDSGLNEFELTATHDELSPPLFVQLRAGEVREADITRLQNALEPGDYGLVITSGDFTERVRQSLKRTPYLRAVDGAELAALTLKYYCGLDERYRAMIPLRMVYMPAK